MPKTEYTPKPRPKPKPKKPPTPAARKGGPKKENLGKRMKGYSKGGAVKSLTEDARSKALEKVDGNVRGYNTGGQVAALQQAQQQQLQGSAPAGSRVAGPRVAGPLGVIPTAQNPNRPMPQESRISGRPPGMSKGGRVKKKK